MQTSSSGDHFNVNFTAGAGEQKGQIAIGKDISQQQTITNVPARKLTEDELETIRQMFLDLRAQVEVEAPPEQSYEALQQVDELEDAVLAEEPDVGRIEKVQRWFAQHLPAVAGAVTGLVVNPLVGSLVTAGGDVLSSQLRARFGGA